ncbi:MAG: hypothetical protein C4321_06080, partial [Chloroflexota bacterium]
MLCAGIDLSWTGRRPSGLALIDAGPSATIRTWTATLTPDEIAAWLQALPGSVVAAIDAPLIVGPGRRAESQLRAALGHHGILAYHIGGDFLERKGLTAGPELGRELRAAGWVLAPPGTPQVEGHFAFETFPRALTVTLLGADSPPVYKRGTIAERLDGLAAYHLLLERAAGQLGFELDVPTLAPRETACLEGRAAKALEDRLDAALCALAAWTV